MKVKICHFSDWHGEWYKLPEADIYLCTGDMYDNYPVLNKRARPFYSIDKQREIKSQTEFACRFNGRRYFETTNASLVACAGNHDFIALRRLFGGETYEVTTVPTCFLLKGLRFGGFYGTKQANSTKIWSGEEDELVLKERANRLPHNIDILISHGPPYGILDTAYQEHVGNSAYNSYLQQRCYSTSSTLLLHCFGHIHEEFGTLAPGGEKETIFSNASRGHILFEIDVKKRKVNILEIKKVLQ